MKYFEKLLTGVLVLFALLLSVRIGLKIKDYPLTPWSLSELLINYQGGFVRRGFLGEIFLHSADPLYYVKLSQIIMVFLFLFGTSLLIAFQKTLSSKLIFVCGITLAPASLLDFYYLRDFSYLDRKEIWFYCSILLYIYIVIWIRLNNKVIIFFSFLSSLMILTHELYFIWVVPALTIVIYIKCGIYSATRFLLLPLLAFFFAIKNSGTPNIAHQINISWLTKHGLQNIDGGAISAIGWKASDSINLSKRMIKEGSLTYWLFFAFRTIVVLSIYILVNSKRINQLINASLILIAEFLALLVSSIMGWDWGRWLSMFNFTTLLALTLYYQTSVRLLDKQKYYPIFLDKKLTLGLVLLAIFFYFIFLAMLTRVDICCPHGNEVRLIFYGF